MEGKFFPKTWAAGHFIMIIMKEVTLWMMKIHIATPTPRGQLLLFQELNSSMWSPVLIYIFCLIGINPSLLPWNVFGSVVCDQRKIRDMSGPQCCSNPPTLNPISGSGYVEKLGGLDSYLTGFPNSKLAVVLVSDIFGTHLPLQNLISFHLV